MTDRPLHPNGDEPIEQMAPEDEQVNSPAVDEGVESTDVDSDADAADSGALSDAQRQMEELRQQLLRVHADFDNFRRRTRLEREDLQKFATKALLADLLPVVDNFERAIASAQQSAGQAEIIAGIDMVRRQLLTVLEQHGVTPMECVGQAFNPNEHEAVMQEAAAEGSAGLVLEVLQKGYWISGKVLRPAMVKVGV